MKISHDARKNRIMHRTCKVMGRHGEMRFKVLLFLWLSSTSPSVDAAIRKYEVKTTLYCDPLTSDSREQLATDALLDVMQLDRKRLTNLSFNPVDHIPTLSMTCKLDAKGVQYNGDLATSLEGKKCRKWSSQEVQRHMTKYSQLSKGYNSWPSKVQSSNFCRNPDGDAGGPWCYIEDQDMPAHHFCNIEICHGQAVLEFALRPPTTKSSQPSGSALKRLKEVVKARAFTIKKNDGKTACNGTATSVDSECTQPGTFGENCEHECHCKQLTCNDQTGSCKDHGGCAEYFSGDNCSFFTIPAVEDADLCADGNAQIVETGTLPLIIISVVSAVVFVFCIALGVFMRYSRTHNNCCGMDNYNFDSDMSNVSSHNDSDVETPSYSTPDSDSIT